MKKIIYILFLPVIFFSCKKNSTENSAVKIFSSSDKDTCKQVIADIEGNIILCGTSYSISENLSYMTLLKTDANLKLIWKKRFASSTMSKVCGVIQNSLGNYILCGDTGEVNGNRLINIIEIDKNGNEIRRNIVSQISKLNSVNKIISLKNGGYLLAATIMGRGSMAKLNSDFSVVWFDTFPLPPNLKNGEENITDVVEEENGNFLATGYTSGVDLMTGLNFTSAIIVKVDANGKDIFHKPVFRDKPSRGISMVHTTGDTYIFTGSTTTIGTGVNDIYIMNSNSNGDSLNTKFYGGTGNEAVSGNNLFCKITSLSATEYILTSITRSYRLGNWLGYLIKMDASGNKIWENAYGGVEGNYYTSNTLKINGGYILSGYTDAFAAGKNYSDFFMMKVDENGNYME